MQRCFCGGGCFRCQLCSKIASSNLLRGLQELDHAERLRDLTTQGWETAQQLLAMAVADLQTAREEKNREKVEAAKKEVQAAEKKVDASPAQARSACT